MNNEFLEKIKKGRNKLETVKIELKKKFIGIDNVIDKIIDNISLWYLTPEIQFRPLIISLWGITGVGKTDLVRTLVKLLDYTDRFIEIQMDMKTGYDKNIEDYLENGEFESNEPAILLLDEIQRYNTIDLNGELIDNEYFNDVWMLLSDGKFKNNSQRKREIMELLLDEMYYYDRKDEQPNIPEENTKQIKQKKVEQKNYKYSTSYWSANRFKKKLNLNIPIEDIMKMNLQKRINIMENSLKAGNINEGKSYEKLLIFISGNLDEAFMMANDVEDTEMDADIYHELSKRVNIVNIKTALSTKFKPEQIARFGNNHIIYPCLDKKSYHKIIKINCYQILDRIQKEHNIKIELSEDIFNVIYRNGVFPAQGVRPVISTVFSLLGSNLPHFLFYALENNINNIFIKYKNKQLYTIINKKKFTKEIILDIDEIRENKSVDERMLFIVHELGHALAYALLFNTPPKQININSSGLSEGFVINHNAVNNKTFIRNQILIYLAGMVAEELVFGEDFKSSGASADILNATNIAGKYVRAFGMDGFVSKIAKEPPTLQHDVNYDVEKTNTIIESILSEEKTKAKDLINKYMFLYKELVKHTINNNRITIEEFLNICNLNGLNLIQKEINDKLIYSYDDKLKMFLK